MKHTLKSRFTFLIHCFHKSLTPLKGSFAKGLFFYAFLFSDCFGVKTPALNTIQAPQKSYHMTLSHSHRFIWYRNAKVCTRTILDVFYNNVDVALDASFVPYDPAAFPNYFKFAFVRNPWDRVVSCYINKVVTGVHRAFRECFGKDFDFFVDFINRQNLLVADRHIQLQTELFPLNDVHFIGRFEKFDEDFRLVLAALGIYNAVIPHKNVSKHAHYSTYYNERTKAIIGAKYKEDIEAFGYEFEYE